MPCGRKPSSLATPIFPTRNEPVTVRRPPIPNSSHPTACTAHRCSRACRASCHRTAPPSTAGDITPAFRGTAVNQDKAIRREVPKAEHRHHHPYVPSPPPTTVTKPARQAPHSFSERHRVFPLKKIVPTATEGHDTKNQERAQKIHRRSSTKAKWAQEGGRQQGTAQKVIFLRARKRQESSHAVRRSSGCCPHVYSPTPGIRPNLTSAPSTAGPSCSNPVQGKAAILNSPPIGIMDAGDGG